MLFLAPISAPIPGENLSRTYYQVLGISSDEQDPRAIEEAALDCSAHVRAYQLTCEPECALRLNEIARALITLLDPKRRREYDRGLGKFSSPVVLACRPPARREVPVRGRGESASPAPGKGALVLLLGEGGACDVKLVYRKSVPRKASHRAG
jgi:hypothetical protein